MKVLGVGLLTSYNDLKCKCSKQILILECVTSTCNSHSLLSYIIAIPPCYNFPSCFP
jgi:hypothetical protein